MGIGVILIKYKCYAQSSFRIVSKIVLQCTYSVYLIEAELINSSARLKKNPTQGSKI